MLRKRFQLALIHVAVAMALVPINSTLNRVMIKEMAISASLVAVLASLPYLFSPLQVVIGSYSDRHPLFGFRRSPYIAIGLLLCVLGVVLAPQAVFLMPENPLLGLFLSLLAFGAWGMGFNVASVSYLSLASELSGEGGRTRTVSVMWFMMIAAIIITAAALSRLLVDYSPEKLKVAFEFVGLAALALGLLGLVRLEPRHTAAPVPVQRAGWQPLITAVLADREARRFFVYLIILLASILGQDVLLEPYGGEAFGLTVSQTTRITSIWGGCVLIAFVVAGWLERRVHKRALAAVGAWGAVAGFLAIAGSGLIGQTGVFFLGLVLLGLGTGLSTVANLSLMLDMTTAQVGLYIGAWGVADALARFAGTMLSGVVRDLITQISRDALTGYIVVFLIEAALLVISLRLLKRIDVQSFRRRSQLTAAERAALLNEVSS